MIHRLLSLYSYVIIASALITWFPGVADHPVGRAIRAITEPVFDAIRRVLPPMGGVDFSPIVALILVSILTRFLR